MSRRLNSEISSAVKYLLRTASAPLGRLRTQSRSATGSFLSMSLLGRMPAVGDTATYRNLRFTVEHIARRRIESLSVKVLPGGTELGGRQGGGRSSKGMAGGEA